MSFRKEEYDSAGTEVVIHFQNEPRERGKYGNHSAWFDGNAVYLETLFENQEQLPDYLSDRMPANLSDVSLDLLKEVLAYLIDDGMRICQCGNLFPAGTGETWGFADIKCGVCATDDRDCSESPDGSHDWKVTNPSQKHNARVSTKKKCRHCDKRKKMIATG